MDDRPRGLSALLLICAPVPALILGVLTMRHLDVRRGAWSLNLAAGVVGVLLFATITYWPSRANRRAWYTTTIGSLAAILATFASRGLEGVHRWVSFGGFGLHVSAIVAPVLIASVATAPDRYLAVAVAAAAALLLAVQPDAAQATSFAAACGVILVRDPRLGRRERIFGLVALLVCSVVALGREDPLRPVRHVEGIVEAVGARGPAWMLLAGLSLLLLPMPYFVTWARRRHDLAIALSVYVTLVTVAPMWGTFPVPIMGYGISPILGYFIALALCVRSTSSAGLISTDPSSSA